jgi:hypothetical protein
MKLVPSTSIISDFNEVFGNPLVVGGLLLARVATALVRSWKAATFSNETAATGSGRMSVTGSANPLRLYCRVRLPADSSARAPPASAAPRPRWRPNTRLMQERLVSGDPPRGKPISHSVVDAIIVSEKRSGSSAQTTISGPLSDRVVNPHPGFACSGMVPLAGSRLLP